MIDAIISGIEANETPEGIETLAGEQWFALSGTLECDTMFSNQVNNLVNLDDPQGTLEIYRSAIADTPLREDMKQGIYCWLCDNGALPLEDIGNFTSAVATLFPGDIPRQIFAQWLFNAIMCSEGPFMDMVSSAWLKSTCTPCDYDCEASGWNLALTGAYTQQWDFNLDDPTEWFAQNSGIGKTKFEVGHGFTPFASPAGSGNFSCIEIYTNDNLGFLMNQIDVGMEAAFAYPTHVVIAAKRHSDGLYETSDTTHAAGADFFTTPFNPEILYDKITIGIYRDDGEGCTFDPVTIPYIRYVTVYGSGINPWA
jgi:hypothetical protein